MIETITNIIMAIERGQIPRDVGIARLRNFKAICTDTKEKALYSMAIMEILRTVKR